MRIACVAFLIAAACTGTTDGDDVTGDGNGGGGGGSGSGSGTGSGSSSSVSCTDNTSQPRDATWTLDVDGTSRTARVHVPASYDPQKPVPMVINVHGRTSTAQQQELLSHAIAKSDAEGFIVIHPQSATSPTAWNAGGGCCDPAYGDGVDDSGFIEALIDEAAAELCIDPDRVYVMGLSNGAYLAHRLACEHADRIAAIAPVAGTLSLPSCSPARPVPMLIVHGTDDSIVQYSWEQPTLDFWKSKNGCTTQNTTYEHGDATCVTYGGCKQGADIVMCTIEGGGHQWPGGTAIPFLGNKSDDLIATDAIWDFFKAHPRP